MKQQRNRWPMKRLVNVKRDVNDSPHLSVTLISRCPHGGSQCIVRVDNSDSQESYTLTRHAVKGEIILSSVTYVRPQLDDEGNLLWSDTEKTKPVMEKVVETIVWKVAP